MRIVSFDVSRVNNSRLAMIADMEAAGFKAYFSDTGDLIAEGPVYLHMPDWTMDAEIKSVIVKKERIEKSVKDDFNE